MSCSAIARAGGSGGETVPKVELLFCDMWLAGLIGLDVVREEIAPVIMGHVVHVGLRAIRDALFFDGADIVRFSVVIPGNNLLCQSPSQFRQMKGCNESLGCSPQQIEVALGGPAANVCATCRLLAKSNFCRIWEV